MLSKARDYAAAGKLVHSLVLMRRANQLVMLPATTTQPDAQLKSIKDLLQVFHEYERIIYLVEKLGPFDDDVRRAFRILTERDQNKNSVAPNSFMHGKIDEYNHHFQRAQVPNAMSADQLQKLFSFSLQGMRNDYITRLSGLAQEVLITRLPPLDEDSSKLIKNIDLLSKVSLAIFRVALFTTKFADRQGKSGRGRVQYET